ncbi:hypothetical protein HDV00_000323 [Rhizophlyctis rosea]|nr:hypothetical protein HDV00_000323 [Rhizophlyctis rosea]
MLKSVDLMTEKPDRFLQTKRTRDEEYGYAESLFAKLPQPADMSLEKLKDEYARLWALHIDSKACSTLRAEITEECIKAEQRDDGHAIAVEWTAHIARLSEEQMREVQAEADKDAVPHIKSKSSPRKASRKRGKPEQKPPASTETDNTEFDDALAAIKVSDQREHNKIEQMYMTVTDKVLHFLQQQGITFPASWLYEKMIVAYIDLEGVPLTVKQVPDTNGSSGISDAGQSWLLHQARLYQFYTKVLSKNQYLSFFHHSFGFYEKMYGHQFTGKQKEAMILHFLRATTDDLDAEAFSTHRILQSGALPGSIEMRFLGA